MTICCFQQLDERAIEYISTELSYGNPLGRLFATKVDLTIGSVFAIVPTEPIRDVYDFKSGIFLTNSSPKVPVKGGYAQEVRSTELFVSQWIGDDVAENRDCVVVSESFYLRARHIASEDVDSGRILVSGDFVYRVFVHGDTPETLGACIEYAYSVPPGCAVLWRRGESPVRTRRDLRIDDHLRETIASNAQALIIGAYDGESVLVWVPRESELSIARCPSV